MVLEALELLVRREVPAAGRSAEVRGLGQQEARGHVGARAAISFGESFRGKWFIHKLQGIK